MVGRGAIGKPWLLAEISAHLQGRNVALRPRGRAFGELVACHAASHLEFYGPETGVKAMRKHLDAYLGQVPGAAKLRAALIRETQPEKLFDGIALLGELDEQTESLAA